MTVTEPEVIEQLWKDEKKPKAAGSHEKENHELGKKKAEKVLKGD